MLTWEAVASKEQEDESNDLRSQLMSENMTAEEYKHLRHLINELSTGTGSFHASTALLAQYFALRGGRSSADP